MERNAACGKIEGASEQTSAPGVSQKKEEKGERREVFIFFAPSPATLPYSARNFVPFTCFSK